MRTECVARPSAVRAYVVVAVIAMFLLTGIPLLQAAPPNGRADNVAGPSASGDDEALSASASGIPGVDDLANSRGGEAFAIWRRALKVSWQLTGWTMPGQLVRQQPVESGRGNDVADDSGAMLTNSPSPSSLVLNTMSSAGDQQAPRRTAATDVPDLPSFNVSVGNGSDSPHRINEMATIVSPTGTRIGRNMVDLGFCAFMRYDVALPGNPSTQDFRYKVVVSRGQFGGTWTQVTPDIPAPFNNSGDPVFAANPSDTGFHPHRIYLAGTTFVYSSLIAGTHPNQVTVWHLDPASSSSPWVVDGALGFNDVTNPSQGMTDYTADKPAIAVSQFPGDSSHASTLGHVYVTYTRIKSTGIDETIHLVRNAGTDTWVDIPVFSTTQDAIQGFRVDVDPRNGWIYLSWLNWTAGKVTVMVSSDEGDHWSLPQASPYVDTLLTTQGSPPATVGSVCASSGPCVLARSMLTSAFSTADNSLILVYHRRRVPTEGGAEVVFQRFTPPASIPANEDLNGTFTEPLPVSTHHLHDQWQGAVACGTDGTCQISYYDHADTDATMLYSVYARRIVNGVPTGSDLLLNSRVSDPANFISTRMEYQDAFFRNGKFYTGSAIVVPWPDPGDPSRNGANSDVFMTESASPLAATFGISAPATVQPGAVVPVTITARDANGSTITEYIEQVAFSSSDNAATLPDTYTFTPADHGIHTFNVTFQTPGVQSFTATEQGAPDAATSSSSTTVLGPPCPYPPQVTAHVNPNDVHISSRARVDLYAIGSGTDLSYWWYQGAVGDVSMPMAGGAGYGGGFATNTSVWVRATDACGQIAEAGITLYACKPDILEGGNPHDAWIGSDPIQLSVQAEPAQPLGQGQELTYQWYAGNIAWPMLGETHSSLTVHQAGTYFVTVTGPACGDGWTSTIQSAPAVVLACTPPVVGVPGPRDVRLGTPQTLHASATGDALTYQWYNGASGTDSSPIAGATTDTITVQPNADSDYWVRVTSQGVCVSNSNTIHLTVCYPPAIATQPAGRSIQSGTTATLTVVATPATAAPLHYTWYEVTADGNQFPVNGNDSPSFTTPALTAPKTWFVRVFSGNQMTFYTDSQTATVSICNYPQVLSAPADQFIAIGQPATLATVTGSGNVYQWYAGASGNTSQPAPGQSTLSSYTASPSVTTQYWAQITNGGCVSRTESATINVCVPTITQQPAGLTINSGTSTTLSVAANTPGLSYQWYRGAAGDTSTPVGTNAASFTTPALTVATTYWVRVTGSCSRSTDSTAATISICYPPAITSTGPVSQSAILGSGSSTTVWVNPTGTSLTFQWYTGNSGNTAAPVGGATSSALTITPQNTTSYWVRVSGSCGASVDSVTMTVTVCASPAITTQPLSSVIFSNTTATLSVVATEATTQGMTYQWYRGASGDTSAPVGTNSTTFTTPALTAQMSYWVRVSCGICAPANSQTATVSICSNPQVLSAPADQFIAIGGSATLTAPCCGSYQWYVGASGNTSQPAPAPSNLSTLTVSPASTTQYWAQIQNGGCTSRTQSGTVNVCIPTFTQQPASITISGGSTTLTASANTSGVTYQWYTGTSGNTSAPIAGATGTSVTVTPGATTSYWVRATGSCGLTTNSATATVTLCSPPVITNSPHDSSGVWGSGTAYLTVSATGSNLTYQWYNGNSGDTSLPINGATSSTLALPVSSTVKVWVRVSGQCGAVNSPAVFANVYPTVTQQPPASLNVGYNATATLSLYAQGGYLSYTWKYTNGTVIATTTTPTLITPSITADTAIYCEVTSGSVVTQSSATSLSVCYNGLNIQIAKAPNGSCSMAYATTYGADNYEWYQGARGDTSHLVSSGGTMLTVCPSTPTQYWLRSYVWSSYGVVSCYSDSNAVTLP